MTGHLASMQLLLLLEGNIRGMLKSKPRRQTNTLTKRLYNSTSQIFFNHHNNNLVVISEKKKKIGKRTRLNNLRRGPVLFLSAGGGGKVKLLQG